MAYRRCKNQLLNWLDGTGDLPTEYNATAAKEAMVLALRQLRQAAQRVEQPSAGEREAVAVFHSLNRITGLQDWALFMDPDDDRMIVLEDNWSNRIHKANLQLAHGRFPVLLNALSQTHPDATWRGACEYFVKHLRALRQGNEAMDKLSQRHDRRLRREADARTVEGVEFSAEEMAAFPEWLRDSIRQEARRSGRPSNWLAHGDANLTEAISYLDDERSREVAWVHTQVETNSADEIKALLAGRRKQCVRGSSFAEQALEQHAESSPGFVRRVLHGMLHKLAPIQREETAAYQALADRRFGGVDAEAPWNRHLLQVEAASSVDGKEMRDDLFPVGTTVRTVVPEVLAAVGWEAHAVRDNPKGLIGFDCVRPDGYPVRLWVRPGLRDAERFTDNDGICITLGQPWDASPEGMTTAINLYVPSTSAGLTPDKITNLVHELGHMVHLMTLPGKSMLEDMVFPSDLIELPSQLLERYVTPERLAAWVRPNASPVYRTVQFWKKEGAPALAVNLLPQVIGDTIQASLDLDLHSKGAPSLNRTYNHLRGMAGLPPGDPRAMEKNTAIMWQADYASRSYVYLWGKLIIERLLPENASASSVAKCYRELISEVTSQAVLPADVRRRWKAWRGETLRQSVAQGAKLTVERTEHRVRQLLSLNPLLRPPSLRQRRVSP